MCGRLVKSLYGTRDAPMIWAAEVSRTMQELGFKPCRSQPCVFYHRRHRVTAVVHVDDFLLCGPRWALDEARRGIEAQYEIKSQVIGPDGDEAREGRFLGRCIRWTNEGLQYEADPKHAQTLLTVTDMVGCKPLNTPGISHESKEVREELERLEQVPLKPEQSKTYRASAALLNYMAQDRMDLTHCSKELSRGMSSPTQADAQRLKRVVRYVRHRPRAYYSFPWQSKPHELVCQVDSDWAGCRKSRRSTSGGILLHGSHVLSQWSRTQATIALSSGEAELNGAIKGTTELLGCQTMIQEMHSKIGLRLQGDSSACQGTLSREGSGRVKHLEVRQLWVQAKIRDGSVKFEKIPRDINVADTQTKSWGSEANNMFDAVHFTPVASQDSLSRTALFVGTGNLQKQPRADVARPRGGVDITPMLYI